MASFRKIAFALALGALALLGLSACSSPENTSIPWSRPASWENQIPGMGR